MTARYAARSLRRFWGRDRERLRYHRATHLLADTIGRSRLPRPPWLTGCD